MANVLNMAITAIGIIMICSGGKLLYHEHLPCLVDLHFQVQQPNHPTLFLLRQDL